ncbi:MAG: phosphoribosyltransferase family protein [Methylococcaceae bacterium]
MSKINFRSIEDLKLCIKENLHKIPSEITLIVGVPRSGMIPASIISTYLNKELADIDTFISGRAFSSGERSSIINSNKYVLIVDDSISSGSQISKIRNKIESKNIVSNVRYLCVYATEESIHLIDYYFEEVPHKRIFEWNLMSSWFLKETCCDIDGVLCMDPTDIQNDDGNNYIDFLKNVKPLYGISSHGEKLTTGWLVTSRLEKYREATEKWLSENNIEYEKLIMVNLQDKVERDNLKVFNHAHFKAQVYRKSPYRFFIESAMWQAKIIAKMSGKPVFCMENGKIYYSTATRSHFVKVNQVLNKYFRDRSFSSGMLLFIKRLIKEIIYRSKRSF